MEAQPIDTFVKNRVVCSLAIVYNGGMQKIILYTKLDCSLCDKAYQILLDIAFDQPLDIDVIDITHTHTNVDANYATRIPVIALAGNGAELGWPFTAEDIKAFLKQ